MTRKELRIEEIMEQGKVCRDAAETLFDLELEDKYQDIPDQDAREAVFETEAD